jgi:hypothetical protein
VLLLFGADLFITSLSLFAVDEELRVCKEREQDNAELQVESGGFELST